MVRPLDTIKMLAKERVDDEVAFLCRARGCPHGRHDVLDHCRNGVHCDVTARPTPMHDANHSQDHLLPGRCCYCLDEMKESET